MKFTKVFVSLECNINLGHYENLKPRVGLEVELAEGEAAEETVQVLSRMAQTEIGVSLRELAKVSLSQLPFDHVADVDHESYAVDHSPTFNWMMMLAPGAARELLAEVTKREVMTDQKTASDIPF